MCFFCVYAIKTPIQSKMYRELLKSTLISAGLSYSYVHYYKRIYLENMNEVYEKLKDKFASNPILSTIKEDQ
jgi:hypothetical protein